MNEIKDLIIGIDFGEKYSQICYFDRKAEEPCSLSMKVGAEELEAPTCVCKRVGHGDYVVGREAVYFAREKGGVMVENLYELCQAEEPVLIAGEREEPWELLSVFLKGMLKILGVAEVVKNTRCLVLTCPSLGEIQVKNLERACEALGFGQEQYLLMDYGESFYYYVLTQKRETWNRSVGWYAFDQDRVTFRRLSMNSGSRPILVRLEDPKETTLAPAAGQGADNGDNEKRDQEFLEFAKESLGNDLYSSIQITGYGFDQKWARKSVGHLCMQRRKVFYGNNLFAKGACAAGKEKLEDRNLKGYRYMSPALVTTDVGMDMRVMGSPTYYPLIEAGKNWYECKAECEFLLDNTQELVFVVSALGEKEKKRVAMGLPGLPKRPNKTTRLRLSLSFTSPKECRIVVKDLGFGEMFPSSGRVWKESVEW